MLEEVEGKYTVNFYKLGGNCIIGGQFKIFDNLYADIYLGFGMRYTFQSSEDGELNRYDSSWID